MRAYSPTLPGIVASILALLPTQALALTLGPGWSGPICAQTGLCGVALGGGSMELQAFIGGPVTRIALTVFTGVALAYFTIAGFFLIAYGDDDATITEQKRVFTRGAMGMAIIGSANLLMQVVAPGFAPNIVETSPLLQGLANITYFVFLCVGTVLLLLLTVSGVRLIFSLGDDAHVEKQKKYFLHALLGIIVLLLAGPVIRGIVPGTPPTDIIVEVGGLVRALLEVFAALAIVALIISGIYYLSSLNNQERKETAKRLFVATLVAVVVVLASYGFLSVFA